MTKHGKFYGEVEGIEYGAEVDVWYYQNFDDSCEYEIKVTEIVFMRPQTAEAEAWLNEDIRRAERLCIRDCKDTAHLNNIEYY